MYFETAGIELSWWIPPLTAFIIGTIASTGGLSGAFVLLPFQVSILGFTTPSVTATNHLYNVVSIPGGVYRFIKEGRMLWPLCGIIIFGTLPGVLVGSWLRVAYMPDSAVFKLFVGCVLLLISSRMLWDTTLKVLLAKAGIAKSPKPEVALKITKVQTVSFSYTKYCYKFSDQIYTVAVIPLFILSLFTGVIGGAYGVGGGAIIAPFLITVFRLPVYTIAGATLLGTFSTSLFAVLFYQVLAPLYQTAKAPVSPDWALGAMFGVGGFLGIYFGVRLQRYVPQKVIKAVLGIGISSLALKYILGYFMT